MGSEMCIRDRPIGNGIPDDCDSDCNTLSGNLGLYLNLKFDKECEPASNCSTEGEYDCACKCVPTDSTDSDGDGVCDGEDLCQGGNDNHDINGNGIPDACDLDVCETVEVTCPVEEPCALYGYVVYNDATGVCECITVFDGDDDEDGVCNADDLCHGSDLSLIHI